MVATKHEASSTFLVACDKAQVGSEVCPARRPGSRQWLERGDRATARRSRCRWGRGRLGRRRRGRRRRRGPPPAA